MTTNTTIENAVEKYRSLLNENRVYTAKLFKHFLLKRYGERIVNELYVVEQEVKAKNTASDYCIDLRGRLIYKGAPEASITGIGLFFNFVSSESYNLNVN